MMLCSLTSPDHDLHVGCVPQAPLSCLPLQRNWVRLMNCPNLRHKLTHHCLINITSKAAHITNKLYDMGGRMPPNLEPSMSCNREFGEEDGILIVDHGSRRAQSNSMLHAFVDMFKQKTGHSNVEPAHMELASPTIKEAFDKCVHKGATRVIITPYFLSPGRHWDKDIPALAAEAAKLHPNTSFIVTGPIGLHELMVDILQDRINNCLSQAAGKVSECEMCAGTGRCKMFQSSQLL